MEVYRNFQVVISGVGVLLGTMFTCLLGLRVYTPVILVKGHPCTSTFNTGIAGHFSGQYAVNVDSK